MLIAKESGASSVHPDTSKLASRSGRNDSRDFWRFADIPIVAWQPHSLRIVSIPKGLWETHYHAVSTCMHLLLGRLFGVLPKTIYIP